jgi:hypothetical protein
VSDIQNLVIYSNPGDKSAEVEAARGGHDGFTAGHPRPKGRRAQQKQQEGSLCCYGSRQHLSLRIA